MNPIKKKFLLSPGFCEEKLTVCTAKPNIFSFSQLFPIPNHTHTHTLGPYSEHDERITPTMGWRQGGSELGSHEKSRKITKNHFSSLHGCCQIWPDLGANFPDLARFPDVEILFPDLARSGQIWESGKFFFFKKKKPPQIWPDLEIWPVFFFFSQISGYCLPGKGTLEFFFSPLNRANFDDLRPFKAKFGTFEHLWGSKTWFCEPEISWFLPKTSRFLKNPEKKIFFYPGKF